MGKYFALVSSGLIICWGVVSLAAQDDTKLGEVLAKLKGWNAKVIQDRAKKTVLAVDFGETTIVDGDLVILKRLPNLLRLKIDRTKVTDMALIHVKDLSRLQALDLEYTSVTDDGLKHIRNLVELKTIDLEGTKISGAGLVHLYGLKELRELDTRNTKVTEDDAKKLRSVLPKVAVKTGVLPRK